VEEEAAFVATRSRRTFVLRALVGVTVGTLALTAAPMAPSQAEPSLTAAQAQQKVDALYEQAETAAEDYNEARLELQKGKRSLQAVQARIGREEAKLRSVQSDIGIFAAASYRNGGLDSSLELLLADDPQQFLERSSSLNQVSRGQRVALRKAALSSQRLAQDRLVLAQELGSLKATEATAQAAKQRIDGKVAEAKAVLNGLKAAERARYEAAQRARAAASARASREALRRVPAVSRSNESSRSSDSSDSNADSDSSDGSSGGNAGSGRAATAVAVARAQVGDRYVWGASGPSSFDCSGLTSYAWRKAGVSLPHQSRAQYRATSRVSKGDLRPGDLVFFYSPISHVGIYIGGGLMVHAANPGAGVRVDSVFGGHYGGKYSGAGRV
jgi:cell wall-associated NlpC family hydrolase